MKRYIGELAIALFLVTIFSFGAVDVWAQAQGGYLAKQIQGSWTLVSSINEKDGKKTDTFGPNPRGFMVFSPEGRFSMILMRESLPKFASNNRLTGTTEENKATVQGSHATFGTYKVTNEKENLVMLHVEGCTFPNWDGQDLPRVITVSGDEMKMLNPAAAIGGKNYLVWKRSK